MKLIRDCTFFLTKAERRRIYPYINKDDHNNFRIAASVIILFELWMFLINLLLSGGSERSLRYRYLYAFLIITTSVSIGLLKWIIKSGRSTSFYYLVTSLYMCTVFLWGVGISVLDCYNTRDLSTFAYSMIATVAIILLEPWIVAIATVFSTVLLNLFLIFSPDVVYDISMLVQSISACLLANVVAVVCFSMRIKRVRAEFANIDQLEEIKNLNDRLQEEAHKDGLTGMYNRRYLTENIHQALVSGSEPSGVLMLDLDFFKKLNDTYGHACGDQCLMQVSNIVRTHVSKDEGYSVRYGGEEILIFYYSVSPSELHKKAEQLRRKIEAEPMEFEGMDHPFVTASIGYASAGDHMTYEELIKIADQYLYTAKENGRNQIYPQ